MLEAVLRHGVMQERMAEWATDGLRALFLEWAGYRTKLMEFVASEHTPKNLMIAAIREHMAGQGLQLANDLQDESSVVGNFPIVPILHEYGTPSQKQYIEGITLGGLKE